MIIKSPLRSSDDKQRKAIKQLHTELMILDGPLKTVGGVRQLVDQIVIESGPDREIHACVFEYLDTDLHRFHITQRCHLSRIEIKSIARQLLEALYVTHENSIVHTDLKPGNFVLSWLKDSAVSKLRIKIIDFGLASLEYEDRYRMITNPCWRSPESWLGMPWGPPADIWSFGTVVSRYASVIVSVNRQSQIGSLLMEPGAILFRPWGGLANIPEQNRDKEFLRTLWTIRPFPSTFLRRVPDGWKNIISEFSPRLAPTGSPITLSFIGDVFRIPKPDLEFIRDILQVDPEKRPTARQLLQHPWLDS